MNNGDNQDPEREVREKIAERMRSIGHGSAKQISGEELQQLKGAANRLDQMLKSAEEADVEALKKAANRLDQLLAKIRRGKEVTFGRKRGDSQPEK